MKRSLVGNETPALLVALALAVAGVLLRVLPHPDNFAPVAAVALFSGFALPPMLALTVPLVVLVASDIVIGPHDLFWLTWAAFAVVTCLGFWVRRNPTLVRIAAGSVVASVFFFAVSNLGVFLFGRLYPRTWQGLIDCYVMAIPFFRNTLAGDLFFSAVIFGVYVLARRAALVDAPAAPASSAGRRR